jgi:predicted nucleic acid-binding protein
MISKVILDTTYIVGLIDERDNWHIQAKGIEERLIRANIPLIFLDCVVNEVINVIVRRFREKKRAKEISSSIEKFQSVCPEDAITWMYPEIEKFFRRIVETVKASKGILNFHDAFILHIADEFGVTHIVSFDKGFDKTNLRRIGHKDDVV